MPTGPHTSGLTVVGNLAVDSVDGRPPTPGGCPAFAAAAFAGLSLTGRIVTQRAPRDEAVFERALKQITVPLTVLDSVTTSGFGLNYTGEQRTMTVNAIGDPWTTARLNQAAITSAWVHVAPLLRSDFPTATIAGLRGAGHRISYDGQGLVRVPQTGRLRTDAGYDPVLLEQLTVLKLADDEAAILAAGEFTPADARRLGVPEILVTFGSLGADVYVDGDATHVAPSKRVTGVHSTGSGDMFAVSYAAARAEGAEPAAAAQAASELVAAVLARRRAGDAL